MLQLQEDLVVVHCNNGELIGITTAIATADVGAEGLGFAVPINLALNIAEDLLDDGLVFMLFLAF